MSGSLVVYSAVDGGNPKQVVTIKPDGSLISLERKQGLDLKQLGRAAIERVSLVEWDEQHQLWVVRFTQGSLKNSYLTVETVDGCAGAADFNREKISADTSEGLPAAVARFKDYDSGVKAEILTINHMVQWLSLDTVVG